MKPFAVRNLSDQSFGERLQTTLGMVLEHGNLPGQIVDAIAEQITPEAIGTTVAVVGLFVALQATPLGWFADAILVGAAWFEFGSVAFDLVSGLIDLVRSVDGAGTRADLCAAADRLSGLIATLVADLSGDVATAGAAGAVDGARLIRRLFSSNRDDALEAQPRPCRKDDDDIGQGCSLNTHAVTQTRREEQLVEQLEEDHRTIQEETRAEAAERGTRPRSPSPAVSRAFAIDADGRVIETDQRRLNLPQDMRNGREETIIKDGTTFTIPDHHAYMRRVDSAYAEAGIPLNDRTRQMIWSHITSTDRFNVVEGLPGLHSEVLAVNDVFNAAPNIDIRNITVGTYHLPSSDPTSFPACTNCSGILKGIRIITG